MVNQGQPPIDLWQMRCELERMTLDNGHVPAPPELWNLMDQVSFVRVMGIASFWKAQHESRYDQRMDDIITSFHGQGLSLLFLALGQGNRSGIYVGVQGQMPPAQMEVILRTVLLSTYPGIRLHDQSEPPLGQALRQLQFFRYQGLMSGIPTRKSSEGTAGSHGARGARQNATQAPSRTPSNGPLAQIERLIRGLKGVNWGYLVRATPINLQQILNQSGQRFKEVAAVSEGAKYQLQQVTQIMKQRTSTEQEGTTLSLSSEQVNREAEYVITLLERQLERLDEARAVGMWDTTINFFASEEVNIHRASSLLRAVFAGVESRPDPVRVAVCAQGGVAPTAYNTALTSIELSTLTQLPGEEFPGYQVTDFAAFDLDLTPRPAPPRVDLGTIDDQGNDTGLAYEITRDDFAKHGLVTGVTGSGKTTTIFAILDSLWAHGKGGIPFLVIEPAKAEYRSLRGRAGNGAIPDLIVYTLGDETISPFRLNPFEFEIFNRDHFIHVQTHIDYLKSVFNAAFILYAPMPYVLEICLHEIYQDCGWDLTSSRNQRLPENEWDKAASYPVFPTLTDLAAKVDVVTERLGYEDRIKMDVQAGLKARIGSLMLGGKGLMLNTRHGIPIHDLLRRPTIVELERIGNDDEKAFLMGLILTRMYEYRRVQASRATGALPFQHLMVVEEAHRLLQHVSTEVDVESANVKGHAVEVFTNMLAEIRSYGQGMLIAEQIPSKLAPDAIKNTNLKLVHRLIAEDDRRALGGATNMNEDQMRYLIALPPGHAAAYSEGADHPYLIQMRDYTAVRMTGRPNDQDLSVAMSPERRRPCFEPAADYYRYLPLGQPVHVMAVIEDYARMVLQHAEFAERWGGWLQIVLHSPLLAMTWFSNMRELVGWVLDGTTVAFDAVMKAVAVHAAEDELLARGRMYSWSYATVEQLRANLVSALGAVIAGNNQQAEKLLEAFSKAYIQATTRNYGPFAGCEQCQQRCSYRPVAEAMIRRGMFRQDWQNVMRIDTKPRIYDELTIVIQDSAEQVVGTLLPQLTAALALCAGVQMAANEQYPRGTQRSVCSELAQRLMQPTKKAQP